MREFLKGPGTGAGTGGDGIAAPLFDYGSAGTGAKPAGTAAPTKATGGPPTQIQAQVSVPVPLVRVVPKSGIKKSFSFADKALESVKYKKTYVLWDTNDDESCRRRHYNSDGSVNQYDPPNVLLRAVSYEKNSTAAPTATPTPVGGAFSDGGGVSLKEGKATGMKILECVEAVISSDTGMLLSYKIDGIDVFPEDLNQQHLKQSCSVPKPEEHVAEHSADEDDVDLDDSTAAFTMDDSHSGGSTCGGSEAPPMAVIEPNAVDCRVAPARIHMHRAYLDNDRMGYASRWEACGLHGDMPYRSNLTDSDKAARIASGAAEPRQTPKKVKQFLDPEGQFHFDNVSLRFISESSEGASVLSGATSCADSDICSGVEVAFQTEPAEVDDAKIQIIRRLQSFGDDPMAHQMFIVAKNTKEEVFIHQLASSLRFGRESVLIQNGKTGSASGNKSQATQMGAGRSGSSGGVGGVKRTRPPMGITVKLWKPQLKKCSTIPRCEALAIGPFGVPPEEEIPHEEAPLRAKMDGAGPADGSGRRAGPKGGPRTNSNKYVPKANIVLKWTIKYLMSATGEVRSYM